MICCNQAVGFIAEEQGRAEAGPVFPCGLCFRACRLAAGVCG
jgi:hypothetical protein